jgi:hypothetical protein
MIDALTEDQLSKKSDEIWDTLLKFEALLLLPNYKPKQCNTVGCASLICSYCHNNKSNICLECKKSPPTLP